MRTVVARYRKEAFEHVLQEFALELLAAIVLIAVFMVVMQPEARKSTDEHSRRQSEVRSSVRRSSQTILPRLGASLDENPRQIRGRLKVFWLRLIHPWPHQPRMEEQS